MAPFERGTLADVEARLEHAQHADTLQVRQVSLHLGAEITGVDLSQPLAPETARAVRDAILKFRVVFFRGANLDHAQHVAVARTLGQPTIGHSVFGFEDGHPEVYSIAKFRLANQRAPSPTDGAAAKPAPVPMKTPWSGYHTDITAAVNPPWCSILRATDVPPFGGDTCWTSLNAAYEGLSDEMKSFVSSLRGVHRCDSLLIFYRFSANFALFWTTATAERGTEQAP